MTANDDDRLDFAAEDDDKTPVSYPPSWKILMVDDDPEVHSMTRLVLEDMTFLGARLDLYSAYSGEEARTLLREHPDAAIIFLDVVMETDHAGLDVVRFIRQELDNPHIRIILRTGQPGQAPEREVINTYDINDYKSKTELTSQKLYTATMAALRAFRDITAIERSRQGLEEIIQASRNLFEERSLIRFAEGLLTQLTSILHLNPDTLYLKGGAFAATQSKSEFRILAGTGRFHESTGQAAESLPADVQDLLEKSLCEKRSLFDDKHYVGYFESRSGERNLLYLQDYQSLSELDKKLIEVFASNVGIAFDNIYLNREVLDTQRDVIFTLGEVAETRSKETAHHVKRVAESSYLLAELAGLPTHEAEQLRESAPMHDIGKIAVPDAILYKPGPLSPEEFSVMKNHTSIGYELFKDSEHDLMRAAAIVAFQHHEYWNGQGYPQGLQGEEIHIYGRICALTDVFDALFHSRCYKDPWPQDKVIEYLRNQRGKQFDPRLTDLMLEHIDDFIAIQKRYPENDEPCPRTCSQPCR